MTPLQIWLPALNSTLSNAARNRDAQRALEIWNGETTVWLLPELDKTTWWLEGPGRRAVAIPSEHLDRIDIYHVGAKGYVVGRNAASRFPKSRIQNLLEGWLMCPLDSPEFYRPPSRIHFEVPQISAGKVTYVQIELESRPTGLLPFAEIDKSARTAKAVWPPKEKHFRTVSPEAESEAEFGPFVRLEASGEPVWASANGKDQTASWFLNWPKPFNSLIPAGDGLDVALGQRQMAVIARQSAEDLSSAMTRASQLSQMYVFDGHSSLEWTWLWPTSLGAGDEILLFKAEDHSFKIENPNDLFTNSSNRRLLTERIPIRRAWGPLGLFWALLLAQLEEHKPFRICASCQRIIQGRSAKKYCGLKDDRKCFNKRRTTDQRRSRRQRQTTN